MQNWLPLFDFLAILADRIRNTSYRRKTEALSCRPDDGTKELIRRFFDQLERFFHTSLRDTLARRIAVDGLPMTITDPLLTDNSFIENRTAVIHLLYTFNQRCMTEESLLYCMKCQLPEVSGASPPFCSSLGIQSDGFRCLNTEHNAKQYNVWIIPRLDPFGFQESLAETGRSVDSHRLSHLDFKYFTIVYPEQLQLKSGIYYDIRNHFPYPLRSKSFSSLKIAAVPLTATGIPPDFILTSEERKTSDGKQVLFSINPCFAQEDKNPTLLMLKKKALKAINAAECFGAHLILFPEMMGTVDMIREIINQNTLLNTELMITPTIWQDHRNYAVALGSGGCPLFAQSKQNSFILTKKETSGYINLVEDLRDINRTIHLYHVPGIGSIAIAICADLITPEYRTLLTDILHVSFILCPSYSPYFSDFSDAADMIRSNGAFALIVNCCGALDTNSSEFTDSLGIITTPWVQSSKRTVKEYLIPRCRRECLNPEKTCLFEITIHKNGRLIIDHRILS